MTYCNFFMLYWLAEIELCKEVIMMCLPIIIQFDDIIRVSNDDIVSWYSTHSYCGFWLMVLVESYFFLFHKMILVFLHYVVILIFMICPQESCELVFIITESKA